MPYSKLTLKVIDARLDSSNKEMKEAMFVVGTKIGELAGETAALRRDVNVDRAESERRLVAIERSVFGFERRQTERHLEILEEIRKLNEKINRSWLDRLKEWLSSPAFVRFSSSPGSGTSSSAPADPATE